MSTNFGKWIVISMTTKCPECGREFTETGKDAETMFGSQTTRTCGFKGELPE
jgi:hypothetical protein